MLSLVTVLFTFFGLQLAQGQEDCINIIPDPVASLSNDTFNFVAGIVSSIEVPDIGALANQSATVLGTVLPGASTLGDITMMVNGVIEGASANFPVADPSNFTKLLTGAVTSLSNVCIEDIPMEAGMLVEQLIELIPSTMDVQAGIEAIIAAVIETFSDAASLLSIENYVKSLNMTITGFGLPQLPEVPRPLTNENIMQNLEAVMGTIEGLLNQTMATVSDMVGSFTSFISNVTDDLPTVPDVTEAVADGIPGIVNQTNATIVAIVEDLPTIPEVTATVAESVEGIVNQTTEAGAAVVQGVQSAINQTMETVSDIVDDIPTIPEAATIVREGVEGAVNQTTETVSGVVEGVSTFIEEVIPPLPEQIPTVSEAGEAIQGTIEGAVDAVGGVLNETGITSAVNTLMSGIMELFSNMTSQNS
eukprot:TRINITY_DN820_c0_g1_i15.p1 TRINITY_DN820_c0_g1~~TRINITY_DN820_c0_g1_i15.p1  ORF type:complete len:419 (-),score=78.92 TRINITY_DN820_c0_g1_i15:239-1495(-)